MKKLLLIISLALIVTQSTQCVQAIAARLGWKLFNAFCFAGSAAQCAIEGFNSLDALQKADNIPLSEA